MKKTGPTNIHLKNLIRELKVLSRKENVGVWRRVSDELAKPSRQHREVNLFTVDLYAKDNETMIVPGKVLGEGDLSHPVSVAAFRFSTSAKEKIIKAGGKVLTVKDVMKANPKGKNTRILG